ncbi:hypothetical protein MPTK1_7g09270 [Marchantia polymorpha subsp. ruderalis]|uniref:peptidylprolyl isomerase n=2 Tax=Marchantia polymorpha TaxID=3197 RepID=A0AAF6BXQ2_MARPO|nr:hypothetical protein MARPO_0068s0080 [Marchantia polymorpha]BBN16786.1 hypothetical protein Mp_7g09270 [Marchantia polymorpha subsp. ruderalis]|eukprot:PTQ35869.1 hypothetical protein MARPO_0068s0080 [Marchantia polymorpha]
MASAQDISGEEISAPLMGSKEEDIELSAGAEETEEDSSTGLEGAPKNLPVGEEEVRNKEQGSSSSSDDEEPSKSKHTEFMGRDDQFPPKVTSEVEELAEGVTKQIITAGRGEKTPSRHSTCFLHYRAWAESTMHKFEDTWQEGAPFELILGHEKKVLRGLAIAVASMRTGETALYRVGYKLGYGDEGNFSFPNVPPKANLIYEVALVGFEEAKEGRPRGEMMVEERIEAADRRRVDGNEFFKENKFEEAIQQYEMALAYMGDDFMFQLFGKYKDMADAVKTPCHLNMAASLLKLERYEEAIGHCTIVLGEDAKNTKALFRRGKARAALGQTDAAKEDFQKVRKLAPDDKAVMRELRSIAEHDRELYLKQKELYKGLFPPAPEEKPKKKNPWYMDILQWFVSIFRFVLGFVGLNKQKRNKAD